MTVPSQSKPSFREVIGNVARSFFNALGEAAKKLDELPLEDKQDIKDGLVRLLSRSGRNRATIKLLTREDEELSRILSARGWWILPRDINGPVKRDLILLEREGKADQIDGYLCSLFSGSDWARLRERIEKWFDLSYFADRKQIVLDGFE